MLPLKVYKCLISFEYVAFIIVKSGMKVPLYQRSLPSNFKMYFTAHCIFCLPAVCKVATSSSLENYMEQILS